MPYPACTACQSTRVMPVRITYDTIHYSCIACGHQFNVVDPADGPSMTQTSRPLPPASPPSTPLASRKSDT